MNVSAAVRTVHSKRPHLSGVSLLPGMRSENYVSSCYACFDSQILNMKFVHGDVGFRLLIFES